MRFFLLGSVLFSIASILTLLMLPFNYGYEISILLAWALMIFSACYYVNISKRIVTPVTCFCLSIFIFILSRPLLSIFISDDIISIGYGISDTNIATAILFVMVSLCLLNVFFVLSSPIVSKLKNIIPDIRVRSKTISFLSLLFLSISGTIFIFKSYQNSLILSSNADYFKFMDGLDTSYFRFFFFAKYFSIIYLIFSSNRKAFLISSSVLFLFSIGFIIIGLRGYTVAYFFLFLIAVDFFYKLRWLYILIIGFIIILISSFVLSFRLGIDVFENQSLLEIFFRTIFQQGASFEVVFGSVNFFDKVNDCITYIDYFSGKDFGACVDLSRGVNFTAGGFASSFFAELYYFMPLALVIIPLFSLFLNLCQSYYLDAVENNRLNGVGALFIFFVIPNLVYFSRSSVFDFVVKSIESIIFLLVSYFLLMVLGLCRR